MKKQVYFSRGQGDFRSALLSLAWKVVLGKAICAFFLAGCSGERNLSEKDSATGNEKTEHTSNEKYEKTNQASSVINDSIGKVRGERKQASHAPQVAVFHV